MIKSVAVIGLGSLGAPIAWRIREAGYDLVACDRNQEVLEQFASANVTVTTSAQDCAAADLILVLVATPDQAREVVLGDRGLVAGLTGEHRPTVAVVSTVSREVVLELAEGLRDVRVPVLDVPVSGGPARALAGQLTVLVAGGPGAIAPVRPVLASMGEIFDCGALGNAQVMKLVNNMVCAASVSITGEALRLALACGLDLDDVLAVLDVSTGRNFMTGSREDAESRLRGWTQTRATFDSTLAIVRKDVGLVAAMAEATGTGRYAAIEGLTHLLAGLGDDTFEHWRVAGAGGRS